MNFDPATFVLGLLAGPLLCWMLQQVGLAPFVLGLRVDAGAQKTLVHLQKVHEPSLRPLQLLRRALFVYNYLHPTTRDAIFDEVEGRGPSFS